MRKSIIRKLNSEKGAVQIVEATFIFPIMFIILFFLLYIGNVYYMRAQIDHIVAKEAIKGASYCADPTLEYIKSHNGTPPSLSDLDVKPYRYFSGMDDVESKIQSEVESMVSNNTISFFKNLAPKKTSVNVKYNNYILYSSFSVEAHYKFTFPIRLLGSKTPTVMNVNSRYEIAVDDAAEFIRNTDMVVDYFIDTKLGQSISGIFEKINSFINAFAKK